MSGIILRNIDRGESFIRELKREISDLEQAAPSDAAISSKFSKMKGCYFGMIEVTFGDGRFGARARGRDLNALCEHLVAKIWEQIETWRTARFIEGLGDGFDGEKGWFGAVS